MNTFSYYDARGEFQPATYADSRFDSGPPPDQLARWPGCTALLGSYDATQVRFDVPTQSVVPRGPCPIASAALSRVVTLSGVPSGAPYSLAGDAQASGTADASGTLSLTFGAAGTYRVRISCFPSLDYSGSFTLT